MRYEQKISHKSSQINLLTEKCNSNDKTINIYNNLNDCIIDQSNKTKENINSNRTPTKFYP